MRTSFGTAAALARCTHAGVGGSSCCCWPVGDGNIIGADAYSFWLMNGEVETRWGIDRVHSEAYVFGALGEARCVGDVECCDDIVE